jgi:exoribonuclease-2
MVRVRTTGTDLLTLDLHAHVLHRIDDEALAASVPADEGADDAADDAADAAGPLTLAIDLDEPAPERDASAVAPAT